MNLAWPGGIFSCLLLCRAERQMRANAFRVCEPCSRILSPIALSHTHLCWGNDSAPLAARTNLPQAVGRQAPPVPLAVPFVGACAAGSPGGAALSAPAVVVAPLRECSGGKTTSSPASRPQMCSPAALSTRLGQRPWVQGPARRRSRPWPLITRCSLADQAGRAPQAAAAAVLAAALLAGGRTALAGGAWSGGPTCAPPSSHPGCAGPALVTQMLTPWPPGLAGCPGPALSAEATDWASPQQREVPGVAAPQPQRRHRWAPDGLRRPLPLRPAPGSLQRGLGSSVAAAAAAKQQRAAVQEPRRLELGALGGREAAGFAATVAALLLAASSGIGGGSLLILIYVLVFGGCCCWKGLLVERLPSRQEAGPPRRAGSGHGPPRPAFQPSPGCQTARPAATHLPPARRASACCLRSDFPTTMAVGLSNVTILGGALANYWVNSRRRHPLRPGPLIDWCAGQGGAGRCSAGVGRGRGG